ncbi:hypothetical protein POSPLADRAFT_1062872 [Postia placenta MAD-698-R-SB12]|uniref:Uncharacterized protein n=1 Tax=Postia placenta MAD-698-R-SB12 TaxID=670580 RepID=A0A1X6MIV5_9APHY|nr:hypothetical protein POSPLADRAFT_1062872 [Postia placenta MAD-698-R-SB12]OSX56377.1 hypothetical protein POSPLADRAFT_1062872 [Postia placenta MAD-698-R-SB12]
MALYRNHDPQLTEHPVILSQLDNREVRNYLLIAAWMVMIRALARIHEVQHDVDVEMEDA